MMKQKLPLLALCAFALFTYSANAQYVGVKVDIQSKNAIIEDFTGINCGYCPDGARKAKAFSDAYPGQVVVIATHGGGYSVPGPNGEPDMTTPFAAPLIAQSDVRGYPAGTVNRRLFGSGGSPYWSQKGGMALDRSGWEPAGIDMFAETTPVNVGFESAWNNDTRELTVDVYLYYTATETKDNYINIALLEDKIIGFQADYDWGTTNNYEHNNTLRHYLTGQWGDKVDKSETIEGNRIQRTYTYTVPNNYVIENCDIVVFVSQYKTSLNTAVRAVAINGSRGLDTSAVGIQTTFGENTLTLFPNPAVNSSMLVLDLDQTSDVEVELYNILGAKIAAPFSGNVAAGTPKIIRINTESFAPGIYFVKAKMGEHTKTIRLTVSR